MGEVGVNRSGWNEKKRRGDLHLVYYLRGESINTRGDETEEERERGVGEQREGESERRGNKQEIRV